MSPPHLPVFVTLTKNEKAEGGEQDRKIYYCAMSARARLIKRKYDLAAFFMSSKHAIRKALNSFQRTFLPKTVIRHWGFQND